MMTEEIFWSMIEQAWEETAPQLKAKRMKIAAKKGVKEPTKLSGELSEIIDNDLVENLVAKLRLLDKETLALFDLILEKKLYDIDRSDIHEYTDGSDDGFLYCRGFIVGMGKEYYETIKNDPEKATMDLEAESFCYFPTHLYSELYNSLPTSEISRETCSNAEGWK